MPWSAIKFVKLKKLTSKSSKFFDVYVVFYWSRVGNGWAQYLKNMRLIIT